MEYITSIAFLFAWLGTFFSALRRIISAVSLNQVYGHIFGYCMPKKFLLNSSKKIAYNM